MARKNDDGSYEISPDERYDFNASHATNRKEYKANLDTAMGDAIKNRSPLGVIANAPDYLNYFTGAGGRGMNIGGKFERPDQPATKPESSSKPNYVPNSPMTSKSTAPASVPASASYAVQAGDTLTSIARKRGVSIAEIAKKNNIQNMDQIGIGQKLTF